MEKVVSVVHQSKGGTSKVVQQQISKTRRKPVKVVYISNPVKIKTSASQFMAVVQELTGQDAPLPSPPPPPHHLLHQPRPAGETCVGSSRRCHQLSHSFVSSADYDDDDDDDDDEDDGPGPEEEDEQYYSHHPRSHAPDDVWPDPDYNPNPAYSYGSDLSFEVQGCGDDDGFMPQLLENFPPPPMPSNLWC